MMNNSKITKAELAGLPIEEYSGKIVLVDSDEDVEKAVTELSQQSKIGFDTETRPSFRKGHRYNVALMQFATENACYLFRINKIGIPQPLIGFLADPGVTKIGLSLRDDFSAIRRRTETPLCGFLDLQDYVGQFGIADASLQKIYAILFGKKISKRQRLTNWEAPALSEWQQKYAALDAWACLVIHTHLSNGKQQPLQ
ncbi:MAG: 3'-5' exonuclease domain-containing protein 2 [Tannerellaceae bacterium]|jgi:ribonuclease D|nr:3'-5' exonuclease domain-containing protein 2 [Tannerellaceae bacterium]